MTGRAPLPPSLRQAVALGLLVLATAPQFSCGRSGRDSMVAAQATGPRLPVAVLPVEVAHRYCETLTFSGRVAACRSSRLGFEQPGRLLTVSVRAGDPVETGTLLARIDDRPLRLQRAQIEADHRRELALLEELQAGPRPQALAAARSRVDHLVAELHLAEVQHRRRRDLVGDQVISEEELDRARATEDSVRALLEEARHEQEELALGTRDEQIAAQQAAVALSVARLHSLDDELERTRLVAPYAGTIAARLVDEGTVLDSGTAVVELLGTDSLEVRAGLPLEVAATLEEGVRVPFHWRDQRAIGTVRRLVPRLDDTSRTQLVILQAPADAGLVIGETVRLEWTSTRSVGGFWVPLRALAKADKGLWSCLVVEDQGGEATVARHDVEVIHFEADRVLVRGSLGPGDLVVSAGVDRIVPGARVEPLLRKEE